MAHRAWLLLLLAVSCGSPPEPEAPLTDGRGNPEYAPDQQTNETPAAAPSQSSGDAPEISRSVGVEGGVVVLWPRIVLPRGSGSPDAETRDLGRALQKRVADLVRSAVPEKPLDVRPEPERVCPKAGCKAASVGVLFTRAGGGCAAIVTVSRSGTAPAKLVPWIGEVRLRADQVGFREPPESVLAVRDYVRCSDLAGHGDKQRDAIVGALRAAAE